MTRRKFGAVAAGSHTYIHTYIHTYCTYPAMLSMVNRYELTFLSCQNQFLAERSVHQIPIQHTDLQMQRDNYVPHSIRIFSVTAATKGEIEQVGGSSSNVLLLYSLHGIKDTYASSTSYTLTYSRYGVVADGALDGAQVLTPALP